MIIIYKIRFDSLENRINDTICKDMVYYLPDNYSEDDVKELVDSLIYIINSRLNKKNERDQERITLAKELNIDPSLLPTNLPDNINISDYTKMMKFLHDASYN